MQAVVHFVMWCVCVCVCHTDGVAEEQEAEEDPDLVFQLEGMHELDLNASPEQLEQIRQQRLDAQAAGPRGGWEGAAAGAAGATAADGGAKPVDELANKLDSLMELAFQHLEHRCVLCRLATLDTHLHTRLDAF